MYFACAILALAAALGLFQIITRFVLTRSVVVSMGLAAIFGIYVGNVSQLVSAKEIFSCINKFPLAAISFFILAGNLMETGGISKRLVEFAKSLVGAVGDDDSAVDSNDFVRRFGRNFNRRIVHCGLRPELPQGLPVRWRADVLCVPAVPKKRLGKARRRGQIACDIRVA